MATICGFCGTNNHEGCIVAVRNGNGSLFACSCALEMSRRDHPIVRCTACGNRREDEVGLDFLCTDRQACQLAVQVRYEQNPFVVQMRGVESARRVIDLTDPDAPKEEPLTKPKKLGEGRCLCCDQPTRGGLFAPGHDTRYVSILVRDVLTESAAQDVVRAQLDTLPKLQAKFDKRLELARELPQAKLSEFLTKWQEAADARRARRAELNPTGRPSDHADQTTPVAYQDIA